jgi:hypothetical protein
MSENKNNVVVVLWSNLCASVASSLSTDIRRRMRENDKQSRRRCIAEHFYAPLPLSTNNYRRRKSENYTQCRHCIAQLFPAPLLLLPPLQMAIGGEWVGTSNKVAIDNFSVPLPLLLIEEGWVRIKNNVVPLLSLQITVEEGWVRIKNNVVVGPKKQYFLYRRCRFFSIFGCLFVKNIQNKVSGWNHLVIVKLFSSNPLLEACSNILKPACNSKRFSKSKTAYWKAVCDPENYSKSQSWMYSKSTNERRGNPESEICCGFGISKKQAGSIYLFIPLARQTKTLKTICECTESTGLKKCDTIPLSLV